MRKIFFGKPILHLMASSVLHANLQRPLSKFSGVVFTNSPRISKLYNSQSGFKPNLKLIGMFTLCFFAAQTFSKNTASTCPSEVSNSPEDKRTESQPLDEKRKTKKIPVELIAELKQFYQEQTINYGREHALNFSHAGGYVDLIVRLNDLSSLATLAINKRVDESVYKLLNQKTAIPKLRTPFQDWLNAFWESMGNSHYSLAEFIRYIARVDDTENKKILVLGEPGSGKTTFCIKLAYTWAEPQSKIFISNQNFDLVFYIDLASKPQSKNHPALLKEAQSLLVQDKMQEYIPENWRESKILWILDNYDRSQKPEEIDKFIEHLPMDTPWTVIVGSRNYACPAINYTQSFSIEGFTNGQLSQYITKAYHFTQDKESQDKTTRLWELAETAKGRKLFHTPYYLRLLCLNAQSALIDQTVDSMRKQWLEKMAKTSRTAFLDQYVMEELKQQVKDPTINAKLQAPLISMLQTNPQMSNVLQPYFVNDPNYILQTFFETCQLTQQLLSTDELPETFIRNKYHPANQLKWMFIAGHLTLFHEANPKHAKSPSLLLKYFGYDSNLTTNKNLFGFYENSLLIRCIDEFCGTHQSTSIHYYAIIARLGKWFELIMSTDNSDNNWLMHPVIKEAIKNSDFIFADPVIGELFLEKLSVLHTHKKNQAVINLLQVISDIHIQDDRLNTKIQEIIFDQDAGLLLRCSALTNQLVTLSRPATRTSPLISKEFPLRLKSKLIDQSESLLMRVFSCFALAMLLKNSIIEDGLVQTELIPSLTRSKDLIVRAAHIYIFSFLPPPDPIQMNAVMDKCKLTITELLKQIENNKDEDTWIRYLACFGLANFEAYAIGDTATKHYQAKLVSQYIDVRGNKYFFRQILGSIPNIINQFFILKDIITDNRVNQDFLENVPHLINKLVKPSTSPPELSQFIQTKELTSEHLQDICNYIIKVQLDKFFPVILHGCQEILTSKNLYQQWDFTDWRSYGKFLIYLLKKQNLARFKNEITQLQQEEPIEQLIKDFFVLKAHLDQLIYNNHLNRITQMIDECKRLPGRSLNDFLFYFFTLYTVFQSLERDNKYYKPLELIVRRQSMYNLVEHIVTQLDIIPKHIPPVNFSQVLVCFCEILRKNHDNLFPQNQDRVV